MLSSFESYTLSSLWKTKLQNPTEALQFTVYRYNNTEGVSCSKQQGCIQSCTKCKTRKQTTRPPSKHLCLSFYSSCAIIFRFCFSIINKKTFYFLFLVSKAHLLQTSAVFTFEHLTFEIIFKLVTVRHVLLTADIVHVIEIQNIAEIKAVQRSLSLSP